VSLTESQYTLHYWARSPNEIGQEESFDDIVAALWQAYFVAHTGGKPTHLVCNEAVLFSGDELDELLKRISDNGSQSREVIEAAIRQALPEVLIKQLVKTVKFSHENFGAVAVYRSMLEEVYQAADQAIQKKDLELLHKITGKLAFWYVPAESDVRRWGKDFLQAYRRDAGWLHHTKKALEKIKKAAKELEVDGARNKELKDQIIKAADDGLIIHI
jgi:hypothetical protein